MLIQQLEIKCKVFAVAASRGSQTHSVYSQREDEESNDLIGQNLELLR